MSTPRQSGLIACRTRIEDARLPKGQEARSGYAELIGNDGSRLLSALYDPSALLHLRELPAVQALRQTWVFQYYAEEGQLRWRKAEDLPPAGLRFDSPYDPEARFGNKRSITWTGYKVHLTKTCNEASIQIMQHMAFVSIHAYAAALPPMPHLGVFDTDAPIFGHALD